MTEPNYSNYSVEDLYDALNHIDEERFPERVEIIKTEIKNAKMQCKTRLTLKLLIRWQKKRQ